MRWLPKSIFGRLVLLMTVGLLVAQLAGTAIHLKERQRSLGNSVSQELSQRIAAIYRAIQGQPLGQRQQLADALSTPRLVLKINSDAPQHVDQASMLIDFEEKVKVSIGEHAELRVATLPTFGRFAFEIYIGLSGDQWLHVSGGAPDEIFAQPWHILINLGVMLFAIMVIVLIAARFTTQPLTQLAEAAHRIADDLKHPPLAEIGPSEVQAAAKAFNAMQLKIRAGIEERERFLAAVSHDLKTPITRLRLRAEILKDEKLSEEIRRDVDEMHQLIDDALEFLRGQSVEEPIQPIDLVALVESIAEDYSHMSMVTVKTPPSLRTNARPRALQRALRNLVQNAMKYGESAHISLAQIENNIVISIDDDGPGIPTSELERVFEPFYRLEASRNRDTGGSGLGLAIVKQIAQSHSGFIHLRNKPVKGLQAELIFPANLNKA